MLSSRKAAPIGDAKPRKRGVKKYSCVSRLCDELRSQLCEIIMMVNFISFLLFKLLDRCDSCLIYPRRCVISPR